MDRPGVLEVDHRGGTPWMPRASHHHRTHLAHQVGFSLADATGTLQKHYNRKNIQKVVKINEKMINTALKVRDLNNSSLSSFSEDFRFDLLSAT